MGFTGWPSDALDFYEGLEADNSKTYWQANKARYEQSVRQPFEALMADLDAEFGPLRLFRPYRDVRFARDKSPYKTAAAAFSGTSGGSGYYVQLSTNGLFVGSGCYHMASDQLARFRAAIDDDKTGGQIAEICTALERAGHEVGAMEELKTAPKGYPKDHPRIAFLRRKGLVAGRSFPPAKWLHTAKAEDRIAATWREQSPLNDWLAAHVGPSELEHDDRER
jgi:uncharacterized protein (TIGR02453 family)